MQQDKLEQLNDFQKKLFLAVEKSEKFSERVEQLRITWALTDLEFCFSCLVLADACAQAFPQKWKSVNEFLKTAREQEAQDANK